MGATAVPMSGRFGSVDVMPMSIALLDLRHDLVDLLA
jgi:hypothetical protein